ncbi:uncharacterized protein FFUJ_01900 [Fusarium fujikuroi IMI 58289]|uniref:NTF2-like domain-containing protein n=1 Tax=Gibberella fujikuroi (strain CBS 195.34 / IMI 58289 / NRRL A-6831) TaxID=1279085 RepID=S0DHX7_GIBF5|nr:uncharacterized protein FFUJ_01900 [Fusarium fujikuroi IMI 58289]CCT61611.1 uncharacterized protein FFUJ_01900 [Fusarium fujikuroi IMI 58289]SCO12535.1 uncharacterized protein FFM5_10324 [Fusarium fujikuroi]
MKAYLALSILACAISTSAKNIHRRADAILPAAGIPVKGGYNAYGGNYDHPETNKYQPVGQKQASSSSTTTTGGKKATTQTTKCISKSKLESIVNKYVSTFSGITDGGALAKTIFEEDWTSSSSKINKYAKVNTSSPFHCTYQANKLQNDDFPPIYKNRKELIEGNTEKTNDPSAFIKGPIAYGCNSFTFYWKGDFEVPKGTRRGRGNGIDMVFLNPETGKVKKAYSEYNTLNQVYNWGAHITWSKDEVCCDCPVVFDPKCKCKK